MNKPVKTLEFDHGIVAKIYVDETATNPIQEEDSPVKVECWHRNYHFGNSHKFNARDDFEEYCKEHDVICLPIYMYDHSGITVSTKPFSCPWDSGLVGCCWITREEAKEFFATDEDDKIEEILHQTVKLLDDYLTGNVYGFVIEDDKGNHLDSCWGFFGDQDGYITEEATGQAQYYVDEKAKEKLVYDTFCRSAVEKFLATQLRPGI